MIALAVGPPLRVAVVAAPHYLSDHPAPMEPADLTAHRCIAYGDGDLSPWSFERDGHAVTVTPGRGPVFNDGDLLVAAVLEGFGILYILEDLVAAPIADRRLTRLLEPWCEPFVGYHLYYPDRRGTTAFELFKEALRAQCEAWPSVAVNTRSFSVRPVTSRPWQLSGIVTPNVPFRLPPG